MSLAKQHQDPFPKGEASQETTPLESVHSDLMSFPICYFLGAKYAFTFIDYFSRHLSVYFLKYKGEYFSTFRTFNAFVKKHPSFSIMKIRTDNGEEYVNKTFMGFCREQGI